MFEDDDYYRDVVTADLQVNIVSRRAPSIPSGACLFETNTVSAADLQIIYF